MQASQRKKRGQRETETQTNVAGVLLASYSYTSLANGDLASVTEQTRQDDGSYITRQVEEKKVSGTFFQPEKGS